MVVVVLRAVALCLVLALALTGTAKAQLRTAETQAMFDLCTSFAASAPISWNCPSIGGTDPCGLIGAAQVWEGITCVNNNTIIALYLCPLAPIRPL